MRSSHQSFHRHITSSSEVRSRVLLLIILSFRYQIFLNQLTMHYISGVSTLPAGHHPRPRRSRRVSPEGAARAPSSPSWRAHQPPPLSRRRRRLRLTGLRPRPHRACAAQALPPPSPPEQSTALSRRGRGGVTRLRAAGRFKAAGRGKKHDHVIP